jgi:succinate-semialdehyde dehydrogenase/glutarate-semialdehyde dehydrogenase
VARIAGDEVKPSVLELGGSDPFIVFADADLEVAVKTAITARLQNTGQVCIAAKRFLVHRDITEAFTTKLVEGYKVVRVGDPMDEATELGPLSSKKALEEIDDQVQRSIKAGATLLTGGKRVGERGFFYEPTILADVKPGMPTYEEETFGPVATLITFDTVDEAIMIANATNFGLGASVWTKDATIIERCISDIEAGSVFVNGMVKTDPRLPVGGTKRSGYGRELSREGLRAFVNTKTVWVQ